MTGTKDTGTNLSAIKSMRTAQKNKKYALITLIFKYSLSQDEWDSKADFFNNICDTAEIKTENKSRRT